MHTPPFLVLMAATALAACTGPSRTPITQQQQAQLAADSSAKAQVQAQEAATRRMYDMFNTGNLDSLASYMGADVVDHQVMDPTMYTNKGLPYVRDMIARMHTAMPDFHQEILGISTTGDKTWLHLRVTGTNSGPMNGQPATGKGIDVQGVDILRFENGKAVEHWGYMEEMKMMQQLGLMPAPDTAAKK